MKLFEPSNFIKSIKEKCSDKSIILYGASIYTVWYIEEYRKYFGKKFNGCVCDGNMEIQGLTIMGHEILSPQSAFDRFSDAFVFIASIDYKSSITASLLTEYKIPQGRILNFEPIEYMRSCIYARSLFYIHEKVDLGKFPNSNILYICAVTQNLYHKFSDDYATLSTEFVNFRDETLEQLLENKAEKCLKCKLNKRDWFIKNPKINTYNLAAEGVCNFRCNYCIYSYRNSPNPFHFRKSIEILHERGLLADDLHIDLTYAELLIHPKRKEIIETAAEFGETITIATNGSVFDESVYELLKSGRANLIVSLDSGTRETFAKIKGVDCFDKVVSNLRKYASAGPGAVTLKFIILDGVNDSDREINAFIDLCCELKISIATVSNDFFSSKDITEVQKNIFAKLYNNNILFKNRIIYKEKLSGRRK